MHDTIVDQLNAWLENFVEVPHPALGGWPPCPYARQARLTGQIKIIQGVEPIADTITAVANQLWQKEVVVYHYPTDLMSGEEFSQRTQQINAFIKTWKLFALDDHPSNGEIVNGVSFNFGHRALLILQLTEKLDRAAQTLAAKGYYEGWPEEYLKDLFHGRRDPRT